MPATIELVIPNMAEYFLRDTALNLTGVMRDRVISFGGTYETEHAVFWSSQPRVLLLPAGFDPVWFADIHRVLGVSEPPTVSPARRTGLLVSDLLHDGEAQQALRGHLAGYDQVRLIMNGPTPVTFSLVALLRGWGLAVELDGIDEDNYWVSLYLDNKVSVLNLAAEVPAMNVAPVITVSSDEELHGAVNLMLARHGRVIARSLHGVAGDGSAVTTAEPSQLARFYETIARDSFFDYPILVQKFVPHADGIGCPAADILIDDNGVQDIVLCSLTVEGGCSFRSVQVGQGALPTKWSARLTELCHAVGTAARDLGYRGWLCIDCVAGADDKLYITEINARRSGSQHAGSLLRLWHAQNELTISAHFMVEVPDGLTYERDIRPVFEPLWQDGVKVYPTAVRALSWPDPILAVIAAAPTADEAEQIVAAISKSLNS
jgi:hypothetical protein